MAKRRGERKGVHITEEFFDRLLNARPGILDLLHNLHKTCLIDSKQ